MERIRQEAERFRRHDEAVARSSEEFRRSLRVGDILYSSWGWEQTNIDFYQVIAIRGSAVDLRQLDQRTTEDSYMCGTTVPLPDVFKGLWQGRTRYDRAVSYALLTDGIDKYEAWERCRGDKEYERGLLLRMRGFLHYRPVPCRCHLEYQRSPVRRIYVGYISFSRQRRRIFPSVIDAQAALVAKGWNPDKFQIVEEDTKNLKSQKQ